MLTVQPMKLTYMFQKKAPGGLSIKSLMLALIFTLSLHSNFIISFDMLQLLLINVKKEEKHTIKLFLFPFLFVYSYLQLKQVFHCSQ